MPELPDVVVYLERLEAKIGGHVLERVRVPSVFVVRSFEPPISALQGRRVTGLRRIGKRLVLAFEGGTSPGPDEPLFLIIHLMIAGRLLWKERNAPIPKRLGLA